MLVTMSTHERLRGGVDARTPQELAIRLPKPCPDRKQTQQLRFGFGKVAFALSLQKRGQVAVDIIALSGARCDTMILRARAEA